MAQIRRGVLTNKLLVLFFPHLLHWNTWDIELNCRVCVCVFVIEWQNWNWNHEWNSGLWLQSSFSCRAMSKTTSKACLYMIVTELFFEHEPHIAANLHIYIIWFDFIHTLWSHCLICISHFFQCYNRYKIDSRWERKYLLAVYDDLPAERAAKAMNNIYGNACQMNNCMK